ncbi:MAG: PLP-dependent aminotransferase family protein [Bacillota bacterium]
MKALLPVFDETRKKPYYLQLYSYIRDAILAGEIKADEKLPSLRSLAKSTALSITTVEQSYNQLLVEGYIYSKPQSGYYVNKVLTGRGQTVPAETGPGDAEVFTSDEAFDPEVPAMQYDPECFDFNKWKKCMNRVLNDHSPALLFEGSPRGEMALRSEISRYLYMSRGVSCTPDQIIIGAGTQQITNQLATLLRKQGVEHVALEDPGYMPVRNVFRDRGFAITPVAVKSNGLAIEKLPANIRAAAYVSPSNHAYTGSVMPVGRRYELLAWAEENNSYIIEDDYDSELRYFGKPIPALKSLAGSDRVIYLGSFSSTLFAALKISYMVLPAAMAEIFSSIAGDYSPTCSKLEQLTLAMFMESGLYQTHIKKLRKLYSQKLTRITDAFNAKAADFVRVISSSSGISIILEIDSLKTPGQIKKDAEGLGIPAVCVGRRIILYYNQIPLSGIDSAVSELADLWRR